MPQEPQPKRKTSGDSSSKSTQDRTRAPRGHDPFSPSAAPMPAPYSAPGDNEPRGSVPSPELRRASARDTRQRAGQVTPTDQMRDLLGRMPSDMGADEPDVAEPEVPELTDVPAVIRQDLSTINSNIQAAGTQSPEWHTINNLPGFMARAIRAMGRGTFQMFTRTSIEDITTIANVNGQGPNSREELAAVAGWLKNNAEDMGESEVDYSRVMPGYTPRVREYRTADTRFHVVQDDFGQYIYAYPESDAVTHSNSPSIGQRRDDQEDSDNDRDEYGARIKRISKESKNMTNYSSTSQIRNIANRLQQLEESAQDEQQVQELIESLLDESSLSKMIGTTPGGQNLVRYLHRKNKLGNDAAWNEHPFNERIMWKQFKNDPDNFIIITGTQGVAGIKPNEADIEQGYSQKGDSYNPANDGTLRYQVVAFVKDQQVDPALFRLAKEKPQDRDPNDPSIMKARGGLPSRADSRQPDNILDRLADQIGRLQSIYIARGAIERSKMTTRAGYKEVAPVSTEQIGEKIKPIFKKLLDQTIGNLGSRIQKLSAAGNYEGVEKLTKTGKEIQKMLTALDVSEPKYGSDNWSNPLRGWHILLRKGIQDLTQGLDDEAANQAKTNVIQGQAKELGILLSSMKSNLNKLYEMV